MQPAVSLCDDGQPGPNSATNLRSLLVALTVFALLSVAAAVSSTGFLEGDAVEHFKAARASVNNPRVILGVWGRPVVTALYALPAYHLGVVGVRLTSLLLAVTSALVTYRIARNQGYRWPAVAAIALCAQPLFFLHSFSELTELPFATLIILAFWAYQARQYAIMALLIGLSPAARPEGFGFMLLALVAILVQARWYWWPALVGLLAGPFLLWNWLGWVYFSGSPDYGFGASNWLHWVQQNWPYSAESTYERGPLLFFRQGSNGVLSSFFVRLPVVVSPIFFPLMWIGVALPFVAKRWPDHRRRCQMLIAALPLMIFAVHSLLWWRGKQGSSGELRYLLVVGPFWALLCAKGWEWAFGRYKWKGVLTWAGVGAMTPFLVNLIYPVVPIHGFEGEVLGKEFAHWYRGNAAIHLAYPNVMASPPSIGLFLDVRPKDPFRMATLSRRWVNANTDPQGRVDVKGSIIIWDVGFGPTNASQDLAVPLERIERAGWIRAGVFRCQEVRYEIFVSALDDQGKPTAGVWVGDRLYSMPGGREAPVKRLWRWINSMF